MIKPERIKERRLELGFTQDDLARKVGVKPPTILRWETGQTVNLKSEKVKALAGALEVSESWLMGWTNDPNGKGNKHDLEVEAILEKVHKDEGIRILLDASAELTKEDLDYVIKLVKTMKEMRK